MIFAINFYYQLMRKTYKICYKLSNYVLPPKMNAKHITFKITP